MSIQKERLKGLARKVRCLRHPYLIKRAMLLPLEKVRTKTQRTMAGEYSKYSMSLQSWLADVERTRNVDAFRVFEELSPEFLRHVERCLRQVGDVGGPITLDLGRLLYATVRLKLPDVVVETGVANGLSSACILEGLHRNRRGTLYSIDLHCREGLFVPPEKDLGWMIPAELRYRWSLVLGESTKVLPVLLNRLRNIDLFLHDSCHTYKTMLFEYNAAWPHLRNGGYILSHDVTCNDAFLDFADFVARKPLIVGSMGIISK